MKNISRNTDLVSVIMPVFNVANYLPSALQSILNQSHKNFELVIVDDHSSDNTWEIIETFKRQDKRVRSRRNYRHMGFGATLNKCIQKARGYYLARMDGDDIMIPRRIEKQVTFLNENPRVVAVGSWCLEINEKGAVIGKRFLPIEHQKIYEMMYYVMGLQHPTVMFNRKLIPKYFSWCSTRGLTIVDDLDVLFRLLKYGEFANIPEFLMYYRVHDKSLSLKSPKASFLEADKVRGIAAKYYGYKPTIKSRILRMTVRSIMKMIPEEKVIGLYSFFRNMRTFHFAEILKKNANLA